MRLADHLKKAVQSAVNETFADEVREIVAKEVRRAFREHESQFASIVQRTVAQAITDMLTDDL
jgi:hypothetical protein